MRARALRRAAMRGALAGSVSATVGLVVGRASGHSLGVTPFLAGFSAGAAQEAPAIGAVTGVAGALVAPRDRRAAIAALIGAATALGTRRMWPVAPPASRRAGASMLTRTLALPNGEGLVVVLNSDAGSGSAGDVAETLRRALPRATLVEVEEGGDLARIARDSVDGASAIAVAGGDGSVRAVAAVAHEHGIPLAVIPAGTLNHFARDLGIDTVDDAVDALGDGTVTEVDLAVMADHHFVNTASIGSYSELVDAREQLEERIGKWPAMVVALIRVFGGATPCTVEIDDQRRTIWMLFVGNCRYHPHGFAPSWRERLDDGQLDVRVVDAHPWSRTRLVAALLTGRLGRSAVYEERVAKSITIHSAEGPVRLACDGETFDGPDTFTIDKTDRPLEVFVRAD